MRSHVVIILVIMGILLSFPQWSGAQWVQTGGPEGGIIHALAVSGTNLFAGTWNGVFLSRDNGKSWTAINSGWPAETQVTCLGVSGAYLFAGTYGGGVWRLSLSDLPIGKR
jgi:hypothetical protein